VNAALSPSEAIYQGQGNHMIELASGRNFDILNPTFDLEDIAHSLSMATRFAGHIRKFYSVADHSVMVSKLMQDHGGDPMEGLLHDTTEFVMNDIVSPHKQFFPDWSAHDKRLEGAMRKQFNLPPKKTQECMWADWIALFIEAYHLLPSRGDPAVNPIWTDPLGMRPQALALLDNYRLEHNAPGSPGAFAFLDRYHEIRNRLVS
jgi:hypothetical protein